MTIGGDQPSIAEDAAGFVENYGTLCLNPQVR
jgi:hypothetical protein